MNTVTVQEAADLLRSYDEVLFLTHVRPDGDTVGSAAALCASLRKLGKHAYLLYNAEETASTAPYYAPYLAPDNFVPRYVVSVDIATTELLPENARPCLGRIDLAIDHHPSFTGFARNNIVRPEAAACAELCYDIIALLTPIDAEIALALYVGVSTDTGGFIFSNTTARTHAIAAALLQTGFDYRCVNKRFFQTKTKKRLLLESAMLDNGRFYDGDRVAVLSLPLSLVERFGATDSDTEDLSQLAPTIEGVDCAVTLKERSPNEWKVSLRTGPRVNATKVCALLGGGGHAAAAGCSVSGVDEAAARDRVLDAIAAIVPDFNRNPEE